MFTEYQIGTPEAIRLGYGLAGIGSRFLSTLVDSIIIVLALVAVGLGALGLIWAGGAQLYDAAFIFFLTASNIVLWGYYILFETIWEGQSPGKRAMGLRVIKTSGMPIGFMDAVVRNLIRIIDFLPLYYGLGVVVMFVSPQSRRLGDYAAGTIVVRERMAITLDSIESQLGEMDRAQPISGESSWNPSGLSLDDQARIRAFLESAPGIRPEHMRKYRATAIAARTAAIVGASETGPPEEFLIRVLALCTGKVPEASAPDVFSPEERAWDVRAITSTDEQLIDEFLTRAPTLKDDARRRLASRLSTQIAGKIGTAEPPEPERFLQRVLVLRRALSHGARSES